MTKRAIGVLLSLLLVLAALPLSGTALAATEYDLWVGGVRVTSANKDDIPAFEHGKASFDPQTNTLTLDDTYSEKGYHTVSEGACAVYTESLDLTIEGKGEFPLFAAGDCDFGAFARSGSLTLKGRLYSECRDTAFYAGNDLTVTGATVQARGSTRGLYAENAIAITDSDVMARGFGDRGLVGEGSLTVTNSTLTADGKSGGIKLTDPTGKKKNDAVFRDSTFSAIPMFSGETVTVEIGGALTIDGGSFSCDVMSGYAVKAAKITLGERMKIMTPEGGSLSDDKTTVIEPGSRLPALNVLIREDNSYPLWIAGVQVNNDNRDDLGEILADLGDANMENYLDGTMAVTFDGDHTLTVKGEINTINEIIIKSELKGLVIEVDGTAYLSAREQPCIQLLADATVTGGTKLNLASAHNCGIWVCNGAKLTLEELTLNVRAEYPLTAGDDPATAESLEIIHSYVHINGSEAAIMGFRGGITLVGCYLSSPEESMIRGDGVYEGTELSQSAVITPGYFFTCGFETVYAEPGVRRTIPWSTNFVPKRLTVIKDGEYNLNADPPEKNRGWVELGASDEPYKLRAYYGDGEEAYVDSREFFITERAEKVSYPLWIGGEAVTSENRQDLGAAVAKLNEENSAAYLAGKLAVSFDGCRTLTLAGDIVTNEPVILNSGVAGLIVIVEGEVSLTSREGIAMITQQDATLTGGGRLTLTSDKDAAVFVAQSALLTVRELTLVANGVMGITGNTMMPGKEALLIDQAEVTSTGAKGAIWCFGGGITLVNSELEAPAGGDIAGGEVIDGEGWRAQEAHIVTVKKPVDPEPQEGKTGDLDGDEKISAGDARLALRMAVGLEPKLVSDPAMLKLADADGSGDVNAADARLILRRAVGFEDPEWKG